MQITEVTILVWVVCGVASFAIAQSRGATNAVTWFFVGLLFGPIGVILAVVGSKAPKQLKRDDAIGQLSQLAQLKTDGHLTPDEYEAKKAELLRRV